LRLVLVLVERFIRRYPEFKRILEVLLIVQFTRCI
jgi:hypothetical protein